METSRPGPSESAEFRTSQLHARGEKLMGYLQRELARIEPIVERPKPIIESPEQVSETKTSQSEVVIPKPEHIIQASGPEAPQPAAIVEHIAKAAEKDAPIERLFELSHEVKDEAKAANEPSAMAVGAILATSPVAPSTVTQRKEFAKTIAKAHQKYETRQKLERYSFAIKTGFWSAVTIAVATIIWIALQ